MSSEVCRTFSPLLPLPHELHAEYSSTTGINTDTIVSRARCLKAIVFLSFFKDMAFSCSISTGALTYEEHKPVNARKECVMLTVKTC